MASRKPQSHLLKALPAKQWVYRASVLFLAMFGLVLFAMDKAGHPAAVRLRTSIVDVVTPVVGAIGSPFAAIADFRAWIGEMVDMRSQNIALKNENLQLLQWQAAAKQMQSENEALRALLYVVPAQKRNFVTVRIVSDIGGPYVHSAIINGGSEQGIEADQAVINENGLVGRVISVGMNSARVLLLSDINSRVPVVAEKAGEKAILIGNNDELPSLNYVAASSRIEVGERIVTTGDGGVFPSGIPVGVVTSVDKGAVRVQPYADHARLEYVSAVSLE